MKGLITIVLALGFFVVSCSEATAKTLVVPSQSTNCCCPDSCQMPPHNTPSETPCPCASSLCASFNPLLPTTLTPLAWNPLCLDSFDLFDIFSDSLTWQPLIPPPKI